jgi:hypothetical protein
MPNLHTIASPHSVVRPNAPRQSHATAQPGSRRQSPTRPQFMDSLGQRLLIYPAPMDQNNRFAGDTMYTLSHTHPPDPTAASAHYFTTSTFPESFLLCDFHSCSKGSALTMHKNLFMQSCNGIWSSNGIFHISGHSFRFGGTNSLLRARVSTYIVNKMGR